MIMWLRTVWNTNMWYSIYRSIGFCLLWTNTVYLQDAFDVKLKVSQTENLAPLTPVNLSCFFKVPEADYKEVGWSAGNSPLLYRYTTKEDLNEMGNSVTAAGLSFSSNPNNYSVQWLTYVGSLCNESAKIGDFKCTVFDKSYSFSDSEASLKFRDPARRLFLNDTEICQNGEHKLPLTSLGDHVDIKFSTREERSPIVNISAELLLNSLFTNSSSHCSYNAEFSGRYIFTKGGSNVIIYEIQYAGTAEPVKFKCHVIVPGSEGLSGGAIAGIVIAVIIIVSGTILIIIYFAKQKVQPKSEGA